MPLNGDPTFTVQSSGINAGGNTLYSLSGPRLLTFFHRQQRLSEARRKSITWPATFTLERIQLVNSPSLAVHLQGSVALPGVAGLTVAVNGSNSVQIDSSGNVVLTGVDATVSDVSATVGGVDFSAKELTVGYATTNNTFTLTGSTSFTVGSTTFSADWGGGSTDGLKFSSGSLQSLNMTVTGDFTVGNVQFTADSLTLGYTTADATYTMTGGAQGSFADGSSTDMLGVQLGGDGTRGCSSPTGA